MSLDSFTSTGSDDLVGFEKSILFAYLVRALRLCGRVLVLTKRHIEYIINLFQTIDGHTSKNEA